MVRKNLLHFSRLLDVVFYLLAHLVPYCDPRGECNARTTAALCSWGGPGSLPVPNKKGFLGPQRTPLEVLAAPLHFRPVVVLTMEAGLEADLHKP